MVRTVAMILLIVGMSAFLGYTFEATRSDKVGWELSRCERERDRAASEAAQYLRFYCEARPRSFLCVEGDR